MNVFAFLLAALAGRLTATPLILCFQEVDCKLVGITCWISHTAVILGTFKAQRQYSLVCVCVCVSLCYVLKKVFNQLLHGVFFIRDRAKHTPFPRIPHLKCAGLKKDLGHI